MKSTPITKKDIDALAGFLPVLYGDKNKKICIWPEIEKDKDGANIIPSPCYEKTVDDFFDEVSRDCWCDFDYLKNKGPEMARDSDKIKTASLEEIKAILTFCVRGERFCSGSWAGLIKNGTIKNIIERLLELKNTL
ncbi:MAG: hypothetical protein HQK83_05785 [Fibrobacteria bacterium]|nr:hypothetical protein [Fibrobacteria bacterium]